MGLFDKLFKKNTEAPKNNKCSECGRRISDRPQEISGKYYCPECFKLKKASIEVERIAAETKLISEPFEMPIEYISYGRDQEVILIGKIRSGKAYERVVYVNNEPFLVTHVDVISGEGGHPVLGATVGLHLSSFEGRAFKPGDVVTDWRMKKTSFVCAVCKKELPLKYRQTETICVMCAAEKKDAAKNVGSTTPTDEYLSRLKKYAMQFIPGPIDDVSTQREMIGMIKAIFPIEEFMLGMQIHNVLQRNSLGELSAIQLQGGIAGNTDRWMGNFKKEAMFAKISQAETDVLLRCWSVLAFYCDILKSEYKVNVSEYYNLIASEIYNRGFQIPIQEEIVPIQFVGGSIHIDSAKFMDWKKANPAVPQFELLGAIPLTEKTPTISLYEDGVKTRDYCLQTEGDENFTGKYFLISVRLSIHGDPAVPIAQIDGFVSDTPEDRKMTMDDVGYRMEGHFLACGGEAGKQRYEMNRGQDLPMKALKYQGYTTPANIRLVGICPDCGKSFTFRGYAFYMAQSDVAYSDDGLDCCEIREYEIDKDTWTYETEGKTFRYYNSFNCPHCGTPYIDYKKHPENKVIGVSGCVHLGRKPYRTE